MLTRIIAGIRRRPVAMSIGTALLYTHCVVIVVISDAARD
jgi:hypothetical protein